MNQLRFILIILFLTASFACENKIIVNDSNQENNSKQTIESQPPVKTPENLTKAMKAVAVSKN